MPSVSKFCERMIYWCDEANLGYSQADRENFNPSAGNCDCSSLVIHCLKEAGFDTGNASYTGNLSDSLTARGWVRIPANGNPQVGDIILNDTHHVCACVLPGVIAEASISENGTITGRAGDQTGNETRLRAYYTYSRGWDCYLRYGGTNDNTETGFDVARLELIKYGSKGEQVKTLQILLNAKVGSNLEIDGDCGKLTVNEIKCFQAIYLDLEIDGECGINTWSKILGA